MSKLTKYEPWPNLPYEEFKETAYLLHMTAQMLGKLKLTTPFEPEWSNVPLWVTTHGLTTGLIPYQNAAFSIQLDVNTHQIYVTTTWGQTAAIPIKTMSVADMYQSLFKTLASLDIQININQKPQEIPNPILFQEDTKKYVYDEHLANNWWRILVSTQRVMLIYHARFTGKTPSIGFMWGTFDLRDARFNGKIIKPTGVNTDYIRRNAMDAAQIEAGWWSGNPQYSRAAFYSFTYPQPEGIENTKVQPEKAHWDKNLGEFILDYADLLQGKNPDKDLLAFFESTYRVGAEKAGWDSQLVGSGKPL